MSTRKTFILDTSVLLYDKCSIHSFPGNDVILTLTVIDELDRFKEKPGLLGDSSRYVIRYLDALRQKGNLYDGISVDGDQTIRITKEYDEDIPNGLNPDYGDNKILGAALHLKYRSSMLKAQNVSVGNIDSDVSECAEKIIIVTKDINLRVKCDALQISAEDYYKDRVIDDSKKIYTGIKSVTCLDDTDVDGLYEEFFEKKSVNISSVVTNLHPNEFVILKSGNKVPGQKTPKSLLSVHSDGVISDLRNLDFTGSLVSVKPRNKEQKCALHLLRDDNIPLVTINGIAGSGKTFLTLMTCLDGIFSKKYERIIFTRSIQPVGREIGFLPGDLNEKMSPWMSPVMDNFRSAFNERQMFDMMIEKGQIEVAPLTYIRGRTFDNSIIVVDEAQNATIHELKTVITRVGKGSKIVLLGDTDQVDTPFVDSLSNGLTVLIEKFKNQKLAGHITLIKGERSEIATLASKII